MTLDELHEMLRLAAEHKRYHAADFFTPVPKQLEFIALTKDHSENMFMAGNGCGKTETAAFIIKTWMTGEYPEWWPGYVFDGPVRVWLAGDSVQGAREGCQTKLLGKPGVKEDFGTGFLPRDAIVDVAMIRGMPDSVDSFTVKHKSGKVSRAVIKNYNQTRDVWQGADIDVMWFDEEPPDELHTEGQARRRGRGRSIMTFTPLKGQTKITARFMEQEDPTRAFVRMSLNEASWYTPEQVTNSVAIYPPHEHRARIEGFPLMGEGKVYIAPRELLETDIGPLDLVSQDWAKIWGIDFGINGFAAVLLAWDRDTDHYYVLEAIKVTDALPLAHAAAMKRVAAKVPVAWPMDGHSRDRMGSGAEISVIYRNHGLAMLNEHATHKSGGVAVYPGVRELDEVMRAGRFHVSRRLFQWFTEYEQYHIKDGQIVKAHDHLMDATRYAWMMRRKAKAVPLGGQIEEPRKRRPTGRDWNVLTGEARYRYGP